jgi:quercetin dioxygenase-like cupin family protein
MTNEPGPTAQVDVISSTTAPQIPASEMMTILVTSPPGCPGTPPHRHSGPAFGCVIEGEVRFELEGEPVRAVKAGETFWEPGGDVIHYQDGNNLADAQTKFIVMMFGVPGEPMLTLVDEQELLERRSRRHPSAS